MAFEKQKEILARLSAMRDNAAVNENTYYLVKTSLNTDRNDFITASKDIDELADSMGASDVYSSNSSDSVFNINVSFKNEDKARTFKTIVEGIADFCDIEVIL